jgi:hypothetical protein
MSSTEFESRGSEQQGGGPGSPGGGVVTLEGSGGGVVFQHPLTVAANAMLNIGQSPEDSSPSFNVFYDIYGGGGKDRAPSNPSADLWT